MRVFVINSGSSTVKVRLLETEGKAALFQGLADRIGTPQSSLKWTVDGHTQTVPLENATVDRAVRELVARAREVSHIAAVGHRVVHGGEMFTRPTLIDDTVLDGIARCAVFAPLHNPAHAEGIRAARAVLPNVPHVAVFDTAFHATMPRHAYRYAIPEDMYVRHGARRYGAHGTSHQFLSASAGEYLNQHGVPAPHRVVTLHLGNGCSVAAVCNGVCVDTSMGFTPLEGLVMGSRSGDIDPALVLFLQGREGWTPERADRFFNKECGLLGVSGLSSDMRDVERARAEGSEAATLAFDLFCYRIKKYVGAYASVLNGLDALVFSGGIGEHSPEVRRAVLAGMEWLGLRLDEDANAAARGVSRISQGTEGPAALVIPTDEEGLIAAQTAALASA